MQTRSFLGVTVLFCNEEDKLESVSLGVYGLTQSHTAEYIENILLKTCIEWNIEKNKIVAVVTDAGANILSDQRDTSLPLELQIYLKSPVADLKQDPLHLWKALESTCPNLKKIALKYLCCTATSTASERLFSKAVYFALGTKGLTSEELENLKSEQRRTKDLLLLDEIEDSYKNLALKVKYSLKWLSENLKKLKYVVKCDDDSFLRIDLIIMNLETYAPNMNSPRLAKYISSKGEVAKYNGLYWGYFDGRAKVNFKGKWEERHWFLCDNYLPYALGGGYVISRNVVDYIAFNAEILSHYNSEDVSMGVWTAALAGINRVHDIRSSRESYGDDAVGYVQLKRESNICTVKCRVCPEHKCHDCAASAGGCKHAVAFDGCIEEAKSRHAHRYNATGKVRTIKVGTTLKCITTTELAKGHASTSSDASVFITTGRQTLVDVEVLALVGWQANFVGKQPGLIRIRDTTPIVVYST
ncbi:Beta-1,3-galactosyltransferase 6 [Eumeta japonica]|uniref:Hexosyltransferase n=1 Tax=Eumeta variegata TaxID=151549 RepID=A0A4C1U9F3_EUMVA|nr:Beta-1,3-galactosyltransferase 6 [Eumeta japonica]